MTQASTAADVTQGAILGLCAAEPATAYELARRMQLHYAYFWPRARSHVFSEVKRLEERGLLRGEAERTGERARTRYYATAAGRRALARFLASEPGAFALQMEPLVRVFLAQFGGDSDLDRALSFVEQEAGKMLDIAAEVIPAYERGEPPPPRDRLRDRVLLIEFLTGFALFADDWARSSRAYVASWKRGERAVDAEALARLGTLRARLTRARKARAPHAEPSSPAVRPRKRA